MSERVQIRPTRGRRRLVRGALMAFVGLFGVLFLLASLGIGWLTIRLSQGPLPAPFLTGPIETALDSRFGGGFDFDVGEALLERGEHGPALVVDRLTLKDGKGRIVLDAPKAQISLDPLALAVGRVVPRRLEVFDIELRLEVRPDGAVVMAAGVDPSQAIAIVPPRSADAEPAKSDAVKSDAPADAATAAPPPPHAGTIESLGALVRSLVDVGTDPDHPVAALDRFGVSRGRLVLADQTTGARTEFRNFDISYDRGAADGGADFRMSAAGPNGRWSIGAHATGRVGQARTLDIEMRDLSLDEIALVAGFRERPIDLDMPISARLNFRLDADRRIAAASGRFSLGAGYFKLDDPDHEPFLVDEVLGAFRWDPATRRVHVEQTQLNAGQTQIGIAGIVTPPGPGHPVWTFDLGSTGNVIAPERPGDAPLAIERVALQARLDVHASTFTLNRLELSGPAVGLTLTGEFAGGAQGPRVQLDLQARKMPVRSFLRFWPSFTAAEARAWFMANLRSGTLEESRIKLALDGAQFDLIKADKPIAAEAFQMDFALSDATLTYLKGAPPMTQVQGRGVISGRSAAFNVSKAAVELAPNRRIALSETVYSMPDFALHPTPAKLEARLQGSVEALLDYLGREGVRNYSDVPAEMSSARGQFDGRLWIDLGLGSHGAQSEFNLRTQVTLTQLSIDNFLGAEKLEAATLNVTADKAGIRAKGEGRVMGAPTQIEIRKPASQPGEAVITLTLDEQQRARRGFGGAGLTGPVSARVVAALGAEPAKTKRCAQVELDFAKAAINDIVPGLSKAAGKPGKATFQIAEAEGGVALDQIVFEGGGSVIRGSAMLSQEGAFQSAKLSQVKLSPGDDLKVDAAKFGEGLKLTLRGAAYDVRPALKALASGGTHPPKDLDVDLKITLLTGHNKQAVSGADLRYVKQGGLVRTVQFAGKFGRDPVNAQMAGRNAAAPVVAIESRDAGALLAFFDFYKRMEGGVLNASIQFSETRQDGNVSIRRFVLRDEPAMRRFVAETQQPQVAGRAVRVDPTLVSFTRLQGSFGRSDAGVLTIRDAIMSGPNIGLTMEGTLDFARDTMTIGGTFVPAYTVNNFFSKIPLFGPLLTGGSNEGLFGVNYRVAGPMAAPVLTVNPLSGIAPGFLRKIFGAFDGSSQQQAPMDFPDDDLGASATTSGQQAPRSAPPQPRPAPAPARPASNQPLQLVPQR